MLQITRSKSTHIVYGALAAIVVTTAGCAEKGSADQNIYTLYRTGIDIPTQTHDETLRIHVATFDFKEENLDAKQVANYNLANCEFAQELFASSQLHFRDYQSNTVAAGTIKVNYWCEKGHYRR